MPYAVPMRSSSGIINGMLPVHGMTFIASAIELRTIGPVGFTLVRPIRANTMMYSAALREKRGSASRTDRRISRSSARGRLTRRSATKHCNPPQGSMYPLSFLVYRRDSPRRLFWRSSGTALSQQRSSKTWVWRVSRFPHSLCYLHATPPRPNSQPRQPFQSVFDPSPPGHLSQFRPVGRTILLWHPAFQDEVAHHGEP